MPLIRCPWPTDDLLMIRYHDETWGAPVHDDNRWLENPSACVCSMIFGKKPEL
ncbi:MAG: DNA-3-methyladenine glycosylase I [Desulfatitalea sp.]|nr:DNA-3-methyladenine glycosylase I [Desulfatitalea sp.]